MTDIQNIIGQLKAWFAPEVHKERDLPGGGKWFYIPWQLIRERFDDVWPAWEVSYSPATYLGDYCTITCTITISGISKQGVGNAQILMLSSSGKDMSRGTPIERATADAFKNAAEAWGVARYLDEQTDPKTKADFVRYMQHSGNGRAAALHYQNEGNAPPKKPITVTHGAFGKKKPPQEPTPMLASLAQMKRFWAIAKNCGYTEQGAKALIESFGFASSTEVTIAVYDELCRKAADPDLMAIYNDRAKLEKSEAF